MKKHLNIVFVLLGLLFFVQVSQSWADWAWVADVSAPQTTTATEKAAAFANKFKPTSTDGTVTLMFVPAAPQNINGTVTAVNLPSGTTANPALVNVWTFGADSNNTPGASSGIANAQQNYAGMILTNTTVPVAGKILQLSGATGAYDFIGVSHPSLVLAGSNSVVVQVYRKVP